MRKHRFFQNPVLFILAVIMAFIACNSNDSSPSQKGTSGKQSTLVETGMPVKSKLINGYLDTLFIDTVNFAVLQKRVTFRFYIDTSDNLTLHGWSSDTVAYNPIPDVILLTGHPSSIQYGKGNYFGNLILRRQDINHIQRLSRKTKSRYVIFAPVDPASTNGQINYNILLTNDDPHPLIENFKVQLVPTGVSTNPSPPRNAN